METCYLAKVPSSSKVGRGPFPVSLSLVETGPFSGHCLWAYSFLLNSKFLSTPKMSPCSVSSLWMDSAPLALYLKIYPFASKSPSLPSNSLPTGSSIILSKQSESVPASSSVLNIYNGVMPQISGYHKSWWNKLEIKRDNLVLVQEVL